MRKDLFLDWSHVIVETVVCLLLVSNDLEGYRDRPQPTGPPQARSRGTEEAGKVVRGKQDFKDTMNSFLSTAQILANGLSPSTSCWVCGLGP